MTNEPNEKPKSNRGGKRPGAGAPKGNMNALKHGRRSRQLEKLSAILASNPETRDALFKYTHAMDKRQATELENATVMFFHLLDHARKIASGEYSPGPFAGHLRLNGDSASMKDQQSKENTPKTRRSRTRKAHRESNARTVNQTTATNAPNNQTPDTKSAP